MSKRKTKNQREAEQLAALEQRITDIYSGAQGVEWGEDDFANAEILSSVIPAIQSVFGCGKHQEWLFGHRSLGRFDNPTSAAKHLFDHGYRADCYFEDEESDA